MENKKKSKLSIFIRIIIFIPAFLISLVALVVINGNIFKFAIYSSFYKLNKDTINIPGLNNGAIQQGITYLNGDYICSTYMSNNKSPSRIYIANKKSSSYVELFEDDEFNVPSLTHTGGIAYEKYSNSFYVASEGEGLYQIPYDTLMNNKKVSLKNTNIKVHNHSSFVFSDDTYLYVGEFNKEKSQYLAEHEISYKDETHKAIVCCYKIDDTNKIVDFSKSAKVFSIIDLVQGLALKDNYLYLSTSWGIKSSYIYKYDLSKQDKIDDYLGAETYFISNYEKKLKCPPMIEDLDIDDGGRIITYSEAGSNKYIFGKLFCMNKIYSIDF